jgi:hypothetical protein
VLEEQSAISIAGAEVVAQRSLDSGERRTESAAKHTRSNLDGSYELLLSPGVYSLTWSLRDAEVTEDQVLKLGTVALTIPVGVDSIRQDLRGTLYPKVILSGKAIDNRNSQPISEVKIILSYADTRPAAWQDRECHERVKPHLIARTRTAADGSFRLATFLFPGLYAVNASHELYHPLFGKSRGLVVHVTPKGPVRQTAEIRLEPRDLSVVEGQLLSESGPPVVGARIVVKRGTSLGEVLTDQNGSFTATGESGDIDFIARHPHFRTLRFRLDRDTLLRTTGRSYRDVPRVMQLKEFSVVLTTKDQDSSSAPSVDLVIAEVVPALTEGEMNPNFPLKTTEAGRADFRVDAGMTYAFMVYPSRDWVIARVVPGTGTEHVKGSRYRFTQPENSIVLELRRTR